MAKNQFPTNIEAAYESGEGWLFPVSQIIEIPKLYQASRLERWAQRSKGAERRSYSHFSSLQDAVGGPPLLGPRQAWAEGCRNCSKVRIIWYIVTGGGGSHG
jgi:hypothetical protein